MGGGPGLEWMSYICGWVGAGVGVGLGVPGILYYNQGGALQAKMLTVVSCCFTGALLTLLLVTHVSGQVPLSPVVIDTESDTLQMTEGDELNITCTGGRPVLWKMSRVSQTPQTPQ